MISPKKQVSGIQNPAWPKTRFFSFPFFKFKFQNTFWHQTYSYQPNVIISQAVWQQGKILEMVGNEIYLREMELRPYAAAAAVTAAAVRR